MALQYSVDVRNAQLDAFESTVLTSGTPAVLKIRSGTVPANCAAADSGTVLASIDLPTGAGGFMSDASSGSVSKTGTWEDADADATGTAGHFRIYDSVGVCHAQGTITATGGGGDMTLDNTSIATGQTVTVTTFSIAAGNS